MESNDYLCPGLDSNRTLSHKREKEEKIKQLLMELLESEKNYVRDLNQVYHTFLQCTNISM